MAGFMGIDNSIGWAHWQLKGGWRNLITTIVGYIILLILVMSLSIRATPSDRVSETLAAWRNILLGLQAGVLVLFAAGRIGTAIRADQTSRMYESHRLMPIPAAAAVSGYLWGPTLQPLLLAAANFVSGLLVTIGAGMGADAWVYPNVILLLFSLFVWVLSAYAACFGKNAGALVFVPLLGFTFFQGLPFLVLPALRVLISPIAGKTIFVASNFLAGGWSLPISQVLAVVAQIYIGSIFYRGAMRKYVRPERTALGVVLALLLLAGWVAISMLGLIMWDDFRPNFLFRDDDPRLAAVASMVSAMIVALVAIANSARDPRTAKWSPLIALLCAGIILIMTITFVGPVDRLELKQNLLPMSPQPQISIIQTALVVCAFTITLCFVLRIIYRFTQSGWQFAAIWIVIASAGPIMLDYAAWTARQTYDPFEMTALSAASPVGALVMSWSGRPGVDLTFPLAVQWIIAATFAAAFYATRKRRQPWTSSN
jgi:hypothetical protein